MGFWSTVEAGFKFNLKTSLNLDEQDRERITWFCFKEFYPLAKEIEGDLSVNIVDGGVYSFTVGARFEGEAPTDKMKEIAAIVFRYAQTYGELDIHFVSEQWDDDPVVKCWYWDGEDLSEYDEYERW